VLFEDAFSIGASGLPNWPIVIILKDVGVEIGDLTRYTSVVESALRRTQVKIRELNDVCDRFEKGRCPLVSRLDALSAQHRSLLAIYSNTGK
jgi:hypothetical protein